MASDEQKRMSATRLGVMLVAVSYLLMVPTFIFLALAIADESRRWRILAPATYALSWMLFIAGLMLAGTGAVRVGRRWVVGLLKGQPVWRQPTPELMPVPDALPAEEAPADFP